MKTRIEFWWLAFLTLIGISAVGWLFAEGYRTQGLAMMGFPLVAIPSAIPCALLINLVRKRGAALHHRERAFAYGLACVFLVPVIVFSVLAVVLG
jgi:hypothetical protein